MLPSGIGGQRLRPSVKTVAKASSRVDLSREKELLKGLSECEKAAVGTETLRLYGIYFGRFQDWLHRTRLVESTEPDGLVRQILGFLDVLLAEGSLAHEGEKASAAIRHFRPMVEAAQTKSRLQKALRGFRKLRPAKSRPPLPRCVVAGIVEILVAKHQYIAALLVLTSERAYLRPGEARSMCKKNLAAPVPVLAGGRRKRKAVRAASPHYALIVRLEEDGMLSKTGTFDETIILDDPVWLGARLQTLMLGKNNDAPLFDVDPKEVLRHWKMAVTALGLPTAQMYQLRHGGASSDYLARHRSLADIRMRGRWRSERSVARYTKSGLIQRMLNSLKPQHLLFCQQAEKRLEKVLLRRICAREPVA